MRKKHLIIAALILACACWNAVGFHQGDEHFQILEFAAYQAGLVDATDLPWEYGERMRPALQPGLTYLLYQAFGIFGEVHPYWFAFFLRLLSAGLFLWVAVLLYRRYTLALPQDLWRWFALLLLFHWCTVYVGIRFSNENWSGGTWATPLKCCPIYSKKNSSRSVTFGASIPPLSRKVPGMPSAGTSWGDCVKNGESTSAR
ncbi:MAG: hypothetical protein AAFZ52_18740, partial [Bacteroidota bacterium]